MRVCINKTTGKLIEAQSGGNNLEVLKQNAIDAGFNEEDLEVKNVSDEEYKVIRTTNNKEYKKQKAWRKYVDFLKEGFTFKDVKYQCDEDAMKDWHQFSTYTKLLPDDTVVKIRAMDNTMVSITVKEYNEEFVPSICLYIYTARQKYWEEIDALL